MELDVGNIFIPNRVKSPVAERQSGSRAFLNLSSCKSSRGRLPIQKSIPTNWIWLLESHVPVNATRAAMRPLEYTEVALMFYNRSSASRERSQKSAVRGRN